MERLKNRKTLAEQRRRYTLRQARKMVRNADKKKTGALSGNAHQRRVARRAAA
jgi:hypothetical protein